MKNISKNPKLKSLLSLSAGAAIVPQIGDAAIVYSGVLNEQVGFGGGDPSYTINLPGTADLTIARGTNTGTYGTFVQRVNIYSNGGSTAVIRGTGGDAVAIAGAGPTFNAVGVTNDTSRNIGFLQTGAGTFTSGAGTFSNQYIAFRFNDSTAAGAQRFGWAELSQVIDNSTPPLVTLHGWAYEDTGATIAMGATNGGPPVVPEASSVVMGAFSALALGGVVAWRKRKQATADQGDASGD